jgi:hypothetical protein
LQIGNGLRPVLDGADEESREQAVGDDRRWSKKPVIAVLDDPLWDKVAETVKNRLQMLLAETDGD